MTFFLKTLLAILVAIVIAGAIFLANLIWFRPWSLNLFYEKAFVEVIFNEPELLTSLGLVEQFGITSHNGKLNDASPAHQQAVIDRWKRISGNCTNTPWIGRPRRKSSPLVSSNGMSQTRWKERNGNFTIIRSISLTAYKTSFHRSWRTRTRCAPSRTASIT